MILFRQKNKSLSFLQLKGSSPNDLGGLGGMLDVGRLHQKVSFEFRTLVPAARASRDHCILKRSHATILQLDDVVLN